MFKLNIWKSRASTTTENDISQNAPAKWLPIADESTWVGIVAQSSVKQKNSSSTHEFTPKMPMVSEYVTWFMLYLERILFMLFLCVCREVFTTLT